jgi:hypothetical protein
VPGTVVGAALCAAGALVRVTTGLAFGECVASWPCPALGAPALGAPALGAAELGSDGTDGPPLTADEPLPPQAASTLANPISINGLGNRRISSPLAASSVVTLSGRHRFDAEDRHRFDADDRHRFDADDRHRFDADDRQRFDADDSAALVSS